MACTVVKRKDGDAVSGFPSLFFIMQKKKRNKKIKKGVTKTKTDNAMMKSKTHAKMSREQMAMPCPAFQVYLSQCQRQR